MSWRRSSPQRCIGVQLGQGARIDAALAASDVGGAAHVAVAVAGIAPQLPVEDAGAAPHTLTHGPQAQTLLAQRRQRHALFGLQLSVSCSHLCNLPHVRMLHFKLEIATIRV